MKTIIKGAIYTDGNALLRPHFTGNFDAVDCTRYMTEEDISSEYSVETTKDFVEINLQLTYEGKTFYECEYSPYYTEDMELISDISNVEYFDEDTDF